VNARVVPGRTEQLAHRYLDAKALVVEAGFVDEIDWQEEQPNAAVSETQLLSEAAWVILNSGMRESVVRGLFPRISRAFLEFESVSLVLQDASACRRRARRVFNHPRKIDAILEFARQTEEMGAAALVARLRYEGVEFLCALPYFGPATSRHLGKILGLDIAKPDRHLRRLAGSAGFTGVQEFCEVIALATGDRVGVVDVVLWRYATLRHDYLALFADA
jgi:hypothetical protein